MEQATTPRRVAVLGGATALGMETVRQLAARGHTVLAPLRNDRHSERISGLGGEVVTADPYQADALVAALDGQQIDILINLIPQYPNSLLHDGHKWRGYATSLPESTEAFIAATQRLHIPHAIATSYTFLYGDAEHAPEDASRVAPSGDPIFQAAIAAEDRLLASNIPLTLLRIGYLYGPQSHDLRLYVRAFRLGRPYFSGPSTHLADWLHIADAARALVLCAEQQTRRIFNVVDEHPSSFMAFMDHFARLLGHRHPRHIPLWASPLARAFIAKQHMELLHLRTTASAQAIGAALGWSPIYADYQQGEAQTLEEWGMR